MERVISRTDFTYYTKLKKILSDLELENKEYWWLVSDIEAYPTKKEYDEMLYKDDYLLITTSELVKMVNDEDFQWIWAVFSVIPIKYSKEEILKYDLPYLQFFREGQYNPYTDTPKLQHPLAEFELYAEDSSSMFLISDDVELLNKFKQAYPNYTEKY